MKPVRKEQAQSGAMTIMEAAFVFPIMFLVIVIMVMLGEAYYQHARVEYEVSHAAVSGAARCENPMLAYVQNNGNTVPTSPSATDDFFRKKAESAFFSGNSGTGRRSIRVCAECVNGK